MSFFTRALIAVSSFMFLAIAVGMAIRGNYGAAATAGGLACFILFMGGMAWFEKKYPLPPLPKGEVPTLGGEARRYLEHYPGAPGKVAAVVLGIILLLAIVTFILRLWHTTHA
ncbi:hypothetical protein RAE19_13025 [Rhodoferax sp. TBRC 17660]|uniref:Uncharacterized protein n=1 Tax=Rhodoferax potami TaxID=3068338 RepID=A0ABU3KQC0_9BURK|nr:hypothetical protein [Rhodoferax sp. TBRC 17660]MDT7519622.1 hypothetical protein [Rhodoferax sp. TBRC 17660]